MKFDFENLSHLLRRPGFEPIGLSTCHQLTRRLLRRVVAIDAFVLLRMPHLGSTVFMRAIAGLQP